MAELFLPSHRAQPSNQASNGASTSNPSAAQITITWAVYRAQLKAAPSTKADDPKTLSRLRELVEA